jgi:tripartite-type tricarboxylate transporter receptor subunit TctC
MIKKIATFALTIATSVSVIASETNSTNFLVGFPPGGGNYLVTKLVADTATRYKITNNLEIKPGAGGIVGINECVERKSRNTLCTVSQAQYVFSLASDARKFDPEKLTYVKAIGYTPTLLVTSPSNNANLKSVLSDMKDASKSVTFAVGGVGLKATTASFVKEVGSTNSILIDYKGAGPAINDVMGKHVQFAFVPYAAVFNQIDSGLLKVVGISQEQPTPALKRYQSIQELVPTFPNDIGIFGFVMAPAVDNTVIEHYNGMLTTIMKDSIFKESMEKNGMVLFDPNLGPEYFTKIAQTERKMKATMIMNLTVIQ